MENLTSVSDLHRYKRTVFLWKSTLHRHAEINKIQKKILELLATGQA